MRFASKETVTVIAADCDNREKNKPWRTPNGPKKFSVCTTGDSGNAVKVNFGDPNMEIKRDDPDRRKNFRARHNCDNPGPKNKARYWSCKFWSSKPVSELISSGKLSAAEEQHYMFFSNLHNIRDKADALLAMDEAELDARLADGHDWACDHISTCRDDIEEVFNWATSNRDD